MPLSAEREIYTPENLEIHARHPFHLLNNIDLSFQGADTQYSTHCIHPYVAAINPPLVASLIEHFVPANGSILDPYCGGGGVLVEALLHGKPCSGNDVNPLAVCISRAKTNHIPQAEIEACYRRFLASRDQITVQQEEIDHIPETIRYWFKEESLMPLLTIRKFVSALTDGTGDGGISPSLANLFRVVYSAAIRDVMLTYRGEVRLRKLQGHDLERFSPDVFEAFQKRMALAAERVPALPQGILSRVSLNDVRSMPYEDRQFTTILCSPPYGDDKNGVGYFQFSSKMLYFLGYDDLKPYKSRFLGGEKGDLIIPPSDSLRRSLENVYLRNANHYHEAVAFYRDYYQALREMLRVTSDRIIMVIGNRVLSRTFFHNAQITVEMFGSLGIDLEYCFRRTLPKKRIANLGGDGGGGNTEYILVFRV